VAILDPSVVITKMVAVPAATPVTTPVLLTAATPESLDAHVTVLFVAVAGLTVAYSVCVAPTRMVVAVVLRVTPVTATLALTTTAHTAVLPPSWVVAVMTAVPAATADTTPVELTVATPVSLELQLTSWSVALEGTTVATRV